MKEQYKRYYDEKRVEAPTLEEGGRVYLRRRTLGQKKFNVKTLRESTKLDQLQLGPFTIKKKLRNWTSMTMNCHYLPAANCIYFPDGIDNMISKQFVQICCMLNGVALLHRCAKASRTSSTSTQILASTFNLDPAPPSGPFLP